MNKAKPYTNKFKIQTAYNDVTSLMIPDMLKLWLLNGMPY